GEVKRQRHERFAAAGEAGGGEAEQDGRQREGQDVSGPQRQAVEVREEVELQRRGDRAVHLEGGDREREDEAGDFFRESQTLARPLDERGQRGERRARADGHGLRGRDRRGETSQGDAPHERGYGVEQRREREQQAADGEDVIAE